MISEAQLDSSLKAIFDNMEFAAEPAGLYDPLRYMIRIGGKRLRPRLCLLAYSMFKDSIGDEVLEPALALEIFHTFTLIHDDIMDKSPLRRGQQTVWKKWNDDTAILSGDVMCIESYRRMAKTPAPALGQVLSLFSRTAAQVCEGQQYDMDFESVPRVAMSDYMKMIGLKTGVLIACSAKVGALIAGASREECELMYEYGYRIGLAFQVADDYLDAYGEEKVFGKPIGGDIVNCKKSWLTNRALKKASAMPDLGVDAEEILRCMALPVNSEEMKNAKVTAVKALYDSLGVARDAKDEVLRLHNEAMKAAEQLKISAPRIELLRRFANSLTERAK